VRETGLGDAVIEINAGSSPVGACGELACAGDPA